MPLERLMSDPDDIVISPVSVGTLKLSAGSRFRAIPRQGEKGDKGDKGDRGQIGLTGPEGSVSAYIGPDTAIVDQALDTFAHGLGRIPYHVQIWLRCIDDSGLSGLGWVVGDVVTPNQSQFCIAKDITNVRVQMSHPMGIDILKGPAAGPTQGESASITPSKWVYFVVSL